MNTPLIPSPSRPAWRQAALASLLLVVFTFTPPSALGQSESAPARPSGLAAAAGDRSVILSWTNPNDASITAYQYQVNHNDTSTGKLSGWSQWADVPNSGAATASYTFNGLNNGSDYRYKIRAVNANGQSKPAPAADPWYVVATPAGPPARPTGLAAAHGPHSVILSWTNPNNATISRYRVPGQPQRHRHRQILGLDTVGRHPRQRCRRHHPHLRRPHQRQRVPLQDPGRQGGAGRPAGRRHQAGPRRRPLVRGGCPARARAAAGQQVLGGARLRPSFHRVVGTGLRRHRLRPGDARQGMEAAADQPELQRLSVLPSGPGTRPSGSASGR